MLETVLLMDDELDDGCTNCCELEDELDNDELEDELDCAEELLLCEELTDDRLELLDDEAGVYPKCSTI